MGTDWRITELWARIRDLCDLQGCDAAVQYQLRRASTLLLEAFDEEGIDCEGMGRACEEAVETGEVLQVLADEKLSSYVYREVPTHWRQLYTDTILLKTSALYALHTRRPPQGRPHRPVDWRDLVRLLDLALIVSGAPGRGRRPAIFFLLRAIQTDYLAVPSIGSRGEEEEGGEGAPDPDSDARGGGGKRRRTGDVLVGVCNAVAAPMVVNPIRVLSEAPSVEAFVESGHKTPFVIKGYCREWKALSTRPWKSLDYLREVAGPGRVVPVEVGKTYASEDWSQRIMGWEELLEQMTTTSHHGQPLYLAQHNLFNQFPALKDDIELPDYIGCELPPAGRPTVDCEDGAVLNVWLGPAGTVSPAHVDPYYNCYAQIVGRKYVWLADAKFGREMYPFGSRPVDASGSAAAAPEEEGDDDDDDDASLQALFMTNTSRVDVFRSLQTQQLQELRTRFPAFVDRVAPEAIQVILEEGDMLVFPPGWWHSMMSLSPSINLSMWF